MGCNKLLSLATDSLPVIFLKLYNLFCTPCILFSSIDFSTADHSDINIILKCLSSIKYFQISMAHSRYLVRIVGVQMPPLRY